MESYTSYSVSTDVKPLLDELGIARIDIDMAEVESHLNMFTDENALDCSPISIHITPSYIDNAPHGYASYIEIDGNVTERHIILPLFNLYKTKRSIKRPIRKKMISYDPVKVNQAFVHEIVHVADYANSEIRAVEKDHRNRMFKERTEIVKGRLLKGLGSLVLGGLGGSALDIAASRPAIGSFTFLGAFTGAIVSNLFGFNELKDNQMKSYQSSPLEARAYTVNGLYSAFRYSPDLVKLIRK